MKVRGRGSSVLLLRPVLDLSISPAHSSVTPNATETLRRCGCR